MKKERAPRNILAIESAVGEGSISLWRDGGASIESIGASRAERIIIEIDGVLREAGLSRTDLSLIAVSIGPGSYSGIRIGVSTAFGLGHALDIPVVGISVLEALASGVRDEKVIAVVPVGRSDLAWQLFETDTHGKKRAVSGPLLDPLNEFAESVKDHPQLPIVAPGHYVELLRKAIGEDRSVMEIDSSLASAIARLAAKGEKISADLKPIYMRSAVAR